MSSHSHSHNHAHDEEEEGGRNGEVLRNGERRHKRSLDPKERLSRLFLLLEAQFGPDSITPLEIPPPSTTSTKDEDDSDDETEQEKQMQKVLERLHNIGIPVPGLEIDCAGDGSVKAKVWLEDLSVECGNGIWKNRVEAVVREAVGGVAELWG